MKATKEPWKMTFADWLEATPYKYVTVGKRKIYMVKGHSVFESVGRGMVYWDYNPKTKMLEWRNPITGELRTKTPPPALRKVLEKTKTHKQLVEEALKEGKQVPLNVLKEYPELLKNMRRKERERKKVTKKGRGGR